MAETILGAKQTSLVNIDQSAEKRLAASMKTAKPSTQTAAENESCKAMVSFLTLLLD
jgi:hypothetical protein